MKKTIILIVSVVVLLFFSSSFSIDGTVAGIGKLAPLVKMENGSTESSIEDYRGKYLLLTFWSSDDGNSRLKCNRYNSFFKKSNPEGAAENMSFVAVNFDKNKPLFEEVVRYDNLDPASQFYVNLNQIKQISKAYNLENGLKSYLIDPTGKIIAVNPDEGQLTKIMS
ncbi:MAG: thioredoxin family protein [Muribaculaceae bacterium]|nr:thioredoxin family protein [Muribaculaceae bacterium]